MYWGIWRRFSYSLRSYCVTHISDLFRSCAPKDAIREGHQKIMEEVELQLENVKVKYDGIISKVGSIETEHKRWRMPSS
jgi:hypothetical protein